jgi:hypothetical protein
MARVPEKDRPDQLELPPRKPPAPSLRRRRKRPWKEEDRRIVRIVARRR